MKKFFPVLMILAAVAGFTNCSKDDPVEDIEVEDGENSLFGNGPTSVPFGALPGVFTVGEGADNKAGTDDDVKVHFSKGNLWADTSGDTPEYYFEMNQYDFQSSWDASHVSSFFWSKTASITYADSYRESDSDLSRYDVFFTNAEINTANTNFTVNGMTGKYRMLSAEEWKYLFSTRANASDKVGHATVFNVHGLIILPDTFNDPKKNNGNKAFVPTQRSPKWTDNVYNTEANWEAMESAGAVFLPATITSSVDDRGRYWSSSLYGASYYSALGHVFIVKFDKYKVYPDDYCSRRDGSGVRLVIEVSKSPEQN